MAALEAAVARAAAGAVVIVAMDMAARAYGYSTGGEFLEGTKRKECLFSRGTKWRARQDKKGVSTCTPS